ncbi:SAF domain-containing protein [Arthrobacter sp. A2-55]|uniref:SAF domain-containing protein n=1 Tax=Arthrobacter sp. A2-55 TaxID=2897337 RepID=UPI0021CD6124|nr:SAF domain-containing protein [Arthrobacter sp. A2-55]MCU6479771.1 RcpC/CpaB family pilus assembly protein [Arthrobacter sp. A2-55]
MKHSSNRSASTAPPGSGWRAPPWTFRTRPATRPERLLRWVLRRRRLLAALLLCAAAALAVQQLTPGAPATTSVLVAARDLPAGHSLGPADLVAAAVSPSMVPDGVLHTGMAWLGRQMSGPARRGQVMTDASLLGTELLIGAPAGSQAVPLRLTDPSTVQLLRQGQLVNVVLSSSKGLDGPTSNQVLATSVPVVWTPALAKSGGGLLPSQETDGLVVVAATAEQAVLLAGASARGKIFLVLVS